MLINHSYGEVSELGVRVDRQRGNQTSPRLKVRDPCKLLLQMDDRSNTRRVLHNVHVQRLRDRGGAGTRAREQGRKQNNLIRLADLHKPKAQLQTKPEILSLRSVLARKFAATSHSRPK